MVEIRSRRPIERNLAMELVRVTEAAALAAARYMGTDKKELVDQAAVDAMRYSLGYISMDGLVVVGEGEKDKAPMLYIGEYIGDGVGPKVDIAVDPVDGTSLVAKGLPGAISVIALSPRGTMSCPRHLAYMDKIAVGIQAKDVIDIEASVAENLNNIARAKGRKIHEVTVVLLDRPRHENLLGEIRRVGARVKLIPHGDIAASIHAVMPEGEVDVLMGVGGTTEAVLSAAAIHCLGGAIQCKPWPRNEEERISAVKTGLDLNKKYTAEDLVSSEDVFLAITGVSSGDLLKGVRYLSGGARTQSLAMRSLSGTVRWIDAIHDFERLDKLNFLD